MKSGLSNVCLFLLLPAAFGQTALGQATTSKPEFDVAVIKQNRSGDSPPPQNPGDGQGTFLRGGQFTMRNQPLKTLLGFAFHPTNQRFRDRLIVFAPGAGAPGWVDTDHFDVVGKAPPNLPPRQCFFSNFCYPDTALADMLRTLVEKEFKIVDHQEPRPTEVYALVSAKGGAKFDRSGLQKSAEPGERNCQRIVAGSDNPAAKGLSSNQGGFVCVNMTMADLAAFLPDMAGAYVDRPVVNLTNLTDAYDFKLTWVGKALIEQGGLTVFEALEKQLGLKMEERKLPIPVTVIDHIEKLDEN
jgi:uncharacterized protein (TIGR03435 family)